MNDQKFQELTSLYFETRQIIRSQLPSKGKPDPNVWLRLETLRFISEAKDPTMHDVARYLRVKAPSATSLVSNLARAGLIVRTGQLGDKRIVRISLTSKGKKLLDEYRANSSRTMRKVFSKLQERELRDLIAILRHVREIHIHTE